MRQRSATQHPIRLKDEPRWQLGTLELGSRAQAQAGSAPVVSEYSAATGK
jgi:hypothetical protein